MLDRTLVQGLTKAVAAAALAILKIGGARDIRTKADLTPVTAADERSQALLLEANSLARAGFFCGALFWTVPAWTGLAIALPALVFAGLVVLTMREHARRDQGEWAALWLAAA